MRSALGALGALGVLVATSAACRPSARAEAPPPQTIAIAAAAGDASAASTRAAPEPGREPDVGDLGAPCPPPSDDDRSQAVILCDPAGRITGTWAPVDVLADVPPSTAELLADEPLDLEDGRGRSLRVGIAGTKIYVRRITCSRCRRVLGWAFAGDLALLSDDDLRRAQARVGFPPDPLLRTREAWVAALAR
jgi:hypothetical protein